MIYGGVIYAKGVARYRVLCDIKTMMRTTERFEMAWGLEGIKSTVEAAASVADRNVSEFEFINTNEIQFDIDTTDNIDILDIVSMVGKTVRGQRFTIERFIGCNVTTIIIENPVITVGASTGRASVPEFQKLVDGENEFTEINTHELCSATPLSETVSNVGRLFGITGLIEDQNIPVANVISEQ